MTVTFHFMWRLPVPIKKWGYRKFIGAQTCENELVQEYFAAAHDVVRGQWLLLLLENLRESGSNFYRRKFIDAKL